MARYARRRAYRRRPRTRLRRSTTARSRRYRRARPRNNVNQLTMRAPLASRLLRVKLPWVKTFDPTISTSGSQFYAFAGSSIVPYAANAQVNTQNAPVYTTGDTLPAGATEYSLFYDRYFVNGSSIKVEVLSTNSQALAASPLVRAVLLAVPYYLTSNGNLNPDPRRDTWPAVRDQLDGYTYEQLLAWPYAKWRMIGANTGGSSRLMFKLFRKTKSMCGIKDLRDNSDAGSQLTDGLTTLSGSVNMPQTGFMYFLKFFNQDGTTAAPLSITVRMSLYCTLLSREFNPVQSITVE